MLKPISLESEPLFELHVSAQSQVPIGITIGFSPNFPSLASQAVAYEFERPFVRSQWPYSLQKCKYKLAKEPRPYGFENGSAEG